MYQVEYSVKQDTVIHQTKKRRPKVSNLFHVTAKQIKGAINKKTLKGKLLNMNI